MTRQLGILVVLLFLSVVLNVVQYAIMRINDREIRRLRRRIG